MLAAATALVAAPVTDCPAVQVDSAKRPWEEFRIQASGCETARNETMPEGARRLFGNGLNLLLDAGNESGYTRTEGMK